MRSKASTNAKYGFASVVDLLRAAGKEGVLRIERDRQGAVRVFPGPNLASRPAPQFQEPVELDETVDVEVPQQAVQDAPPVEEAVEEVIETPIIEPEPVDEVGRRNGSCRGRSGSRGEAEAVACTKDDRRACVEDGEAACEEASTYELMIC